MKPSFNQLTAWVASPDRIGFVKFIVESYDGLAILSTTNSGSGEILLRFHPEQRDDLVSLLSVLGVRVAPAPAACFSKVDS